MKRITFIIAATLAVACGGRETVIVNPEFDASGVDHYMALSRIKRADTATVVYADVYNLPNYWVYLSSGGKLRDGKGKTYKLLACEGFQLDKEVFMPASGTMSLTLYFEPVDKDEKVVDYIDLDEDNESIIGIKLYNIKHAGAVRCLLKGEVIDRPQSNRLLLLKAGENPRAARVTYIPVRDGKFEYTLHARAEEAYQLIFYDEERAGIMHPVDFITETGTLDFTLHPMDRWEENVVKGSKYTDAYHALVDSLNARADVLYCALNEKRERLEKENRYYTPGFRALLAQIDALDYEDDTRRHALFGQLSRMREEGTHLGEEGKALDKEAERIYKTVYADNMLAYARRHADVTGYTFLVENMRRAVESSHLNLDAAPMLAIFHDIYEKKFPGHPYTSLMQSYEQASAIQPGNPCPDVSALDASTGEEVRLADLIKGNKVTLVHLWASWCGPCRAHGKAMIPVYEMYKDKGFTVIGISREQKKEAMDMAVEKDKYPWVNLLELNDEHGIWTKFGIGNAAGGEFLVDEQGNFLAIGATPDEMKKILQGLLD
ncbi:MAG: TlpA family protein disulfide reductase [Odoribacteraceae bacterium]|jgi:thiol-disulfide isomerase/thioredoxin|nr:TlpA family protein disulfide reductase [Odoribacteraceae bacterium]